MDILSAASMPWLDEPMQRLREARAARRVPQSLLIISAPGLGAERLAAWSAALVLCESPDSAPCGTCPSCVLLRAETHPDFHAVRLLEDAQQIKVDQIRDLIESLSLSSFRGGYKAAVVESAEALNANGANAFLKTLEEPMGETMLILVARPSHRLPATIASRCQRIRLRAPSHEVALAWLAAHGPGVASWDAALALASGAPLMAIDLEAANIGQLSRELSESLERLAAGTIDAASLAERWMKTDLALCLIWLENWITQRVRADLGGETSAQSAEPVGLPGALLKPKMRALFELLDAARDLRRLSSTGLNQQLALEALLLGGRRALAG